MADNVILEIFCFEHLRFEEVIPTKGKFSKGEEKA
jgi:hypothetical protein